MQFARGRVPTRAKIRPGSTADRRHQAWAPWLLFGFLPDTRELTFGFHGNVPPAGPAVASVGGGARLERISLSSEQILTWAWASIPLYATQSISCSAQVLLENLGKDSLRSMLRKSLP